MCSVYSAGLCSYLFHDCRGDCVVNYFPFSDVLCLYYSVTYGVRVLSHVLRIGFTLYCVYACVCMYVCICVCMCACVCVRAWVCV